MDGLLFCHAHSKLSYKPHLDLCARKEEMRTSTDSCSDEAVIDSGLEPPS
ncbi:hypothetical protein JMJ77_0004631 [Colletotrichum scovillei]|uniref:Uncharacterized protein n=1 Tax=Colletotrichum scovillei TaxID=1209932 RepID=A0A9P7RI01_9PEZI|nr:hypothetical protein JMJ77_0004631 [Colletotrichum scovillei]KAG7075875.1 hypothetical protein JMJ76_0013149 [Colletotrichum scovillei]KAG7082988.1 hypothetical protein JMJ78_0008439 [Colletotrichum scovillei]